MTSVRSSEIKAVDAALKNYETTPDAANKHATMKALVRWFQKEGPNWKNSIRNKRHAVDKLHQQHPATAHRGGRSGFAYTWEYKTTVRSSSGGVTIKEFGAFAWIGGRWILANVGGKPFTPNDSSSWYGAPAAELTPGKEFSDPVNWSGSSELEPASSRWYFIGVNEKGESVKGEAEIKELAEVVP